MPAVAYKNTSIHYSGNFDPREVPSLGLWLDAGYGLTLNGPTVSSWTSKDPNQFAFTQATGANQPTYIPTDSTLNGKPCLAFNGTSTRLFTTAVGPGNLTNNISGCSIFLVWKSTNVGAARTALHISTNSSIGARIQIGKNTTNNTLIAGRRLDADSLVQVAGSTTPTGYIYTSGVFDYLNTKATMWENGIQKAQNLSFQTSGNTSATTSNNISIGSSGTPGNWVNGNIAELLLYPYAMNDQLRAAIENYLKQKYGF